MVHVAEAERRGDRGQDEIRIVERAEFDEPDAVGKVRRDLGRDLQREAGLADAAWPGQRDEGDVFAPQQADNGRHVVLAPDQGRAREGNR